MSAAPSAAPMAAVLGSEATGVGAVPSGAPQVERATWDGVQMVGQLVAALEAQARLTQQLASRLDALSRSLGLRPAPPGSPGSAAWPAGVDVPAAGEPPGAPAGPWASPRAAALPGPEDSPEREEAQEGAPAGAVAAYCFGGFTLAADGVRVDGGVGGLAGKTLALLQYLVAHHGRPVPREALIAALWPDPEAAAAGTSLKVAVHTLRRALARLPGAAGHLAVEAEGAGYRLVAPAGGLWLDAEAFERCCARGRRLEAQGCPEAALVCFAGAAALYRGDFLGDSWEDWAVFRREGLKDQYLFVLARLADAALAAGDFESCAARCRQLLAHDRCREDTYRTLMLCHARLGQRARVRRWFELCARTLRAELGLAPEPATVRLYQRLLCESPAEPDALAAPATVAPSAAGATA